MTTDNQSPNPGPGPTAAGFTHVEWLRYLLRHSLGAIEAGANASLVMNLEGLKDNIKKVLAVEAPEGGPATIWHNAALGDFTTRDPGDELGWIEYRAAIAGQHQAETWTGAAAFIQHAQNVAGAPGHWPDEFLAWYKPDDWAGEHRAAAVWIGTKMADRPAKAEGDAPAARMPEGWKFERDGDEGILVLAPGRSPFTAWPDKGMRETTGGLLWKLCGELLSATQPQPKGLAAAARELSDFFWSENLGHVPAALVANLREALGGVRAAAVGDADDTARLDWLLLAISGAEFRRIGVHYSGNASRADVDAAMAPSMTQVQPTGGV